MSAKPLLDEAVLGDMIAHIGEGALRPIIELFVAETTTLAARIVAGAADPEGRDAVRQAAHSLKSSAGQVGAMALAEAAAEIERAAESGAPLAAAAAALARYAEASNAALTALLAG